MRFPLTVLHPRFLLAVLAGALCLALPTQAGAPRGNILERDKLVILSTTDVKGKTDPCGCHTPKGGLARRASFVDSIRATYGQVLLVDDGSFFPEDDQHQDVSWFLMDAMSLLHTDAVGMSEKELRFGLGYLQAQLKRTRLTMVCANLFEKKTGKTVLPPFVVKQVGTVKVGLFGLMSPALDLGPSRDSLRVEEPTTVARRTVAELRKKGATVVVLLSQLGKVESEDLVTAVDGIDAVLVGHGAPLLQKGRMIKNTVACYGGEQGHYVGRTLLTLDAKRRMTTGESEAFILGPDIPDDKVMAKLVRDFTDTFNEKQERQKKERETAKAAPAAAEEPKASPTP